MIDTTMRREKEGNEKREHTVAIISLRFFSPSSQVLRVVLSKLQTIEEEMEEKEPENSLVK